MAAGDNLGGARVRGAAEACLAAVLALCVPAAAQETVTPPTDFGDGADLIVVSEVELGADESTALLNFTATTDYFGAIAVDPGPGDTYYWVAGYQSQALAMEAAHMGCTALLKTGGSCVIHARIDPVDYRPRLGRPVELGAPAARNWRGFYLGGIKPDSYAAFALSNLTSGAAVAMPTQAEADSAALVECEAAAANAMKDMSSATRDLVRNGGHNVCRIVDRRGP